MPLTHDVLIIGGGSAGYAAARTAQAEGADVGIVDPGPLGGLCILRGCMPTKTILRSSDIAALIRRASEFGLEAPSLDIHLKNIIQRKNRLIQEFADDRIEALQSPRFTLYQEAAHFLSPTEVQAGPHRITAQSFIISTGSLVARIPIPGLEEAGYITSDEALELLSLPESLIVLGAGPVALELAQFFCRLGVNVTLLQRSPHILSQFDEDLARPVEEKLTQEGMQIFTNTQIVRVQASDREKIIHFLHKGESQQVSGSMILQALGRRPNIDALNLEAAHISPQPSAVPVNSEMKTSQPHIFAVGDVNGIHEIVHIAIEQGEIAGWNAAHPDLTQKRYDDRLKTQVIFTDPQVASVGLSERECQDQELPYLVSSYPFNDHGKSLCLGETHGHVKVLCRPQTGTILGGHIAGPEASELIHELIAMMYFRGTVHDLLRMPHYHPTLAEILTYPAEDLIDRLSNTT